MSKIKAIVLDAGGVLMHPLHGHWWIPADYETLMGEAAKDIGSEKWLNACKAEAELLREDVYMRTLEEEYRQKLLFMTNVAVRMAWKMSADELSALAENFTYSPARYAWYEDTAQWLEKWHGEMKVGILSDSLPSFRLAVDSYPAREFLDATVISTDVGATKPDMRMYNAICAKLNVAAEECLFVDDRQCNLEGARAYGMQAVQMCREGGEGDGGPCVHDLKELNAYMEGLN